MKMEKDHLNDKVLDKEKALSVIKTSYLNSYKIPKPVITNRHNISPIEVKDGVIYLPLYMAGLL